MGARQPRASGDCRGQYDSVYRILWLGGRTDLAATSVTIDSEAVRRLGRRKRRREGVAQLDWSPVEVRQADWREARNNREGLAQDNGWTASLDAIQAKDRPQRKRVIDVCGRS